MRSHTDEEEKDRVSEVKMMKIRTLTSMVVAREQHLDMKRYFLLCFTLKKLNKCV